MQLQGLQLHEMLVGFTQGCVFVLQLCWSKTMTQTQLEIVVPKLLQNTKCKECETRSMNLPQRLTEQLL